MVRIIDDVKLDFKDVLITPKWSDTPSRSDIQLERTYNFRNSGRSWTGVPVIAANMDSTGTFAMARALSPYKMMTSLHKHYSVKSLVNFFGNATPEILSNTFYTLGIGQDDIDKLDKVVAEIGRDRIINYTIDVANGYTEYFLSSVKAFRRKFPQCNIMAGNVATPDIVHSLLLSGSADIVKCGIGGGSVCTTRLVAGVGFPQLSCVLDCADAAHGVGGQICSDGGITDPGDIGKAFGAGAHFVMLGSFLSGTDECEGEWIEKREVITPEDGGPLVSTGEIVKTHLKFYGMASKEANNKYYGGVASHRAAEGKCVMVPYKGPVSEIAQRILGGLRSTCTYVGAKKLKNLSQCTTFVKVNRTHNTIYGER